MFLNVNMNMLGFVVLYTSDFLFPQEIFQDRILLTNNHKTSQNEITSQ